MFSFIDDFLVGVFNVYLILGQVFFESHCISTPHSSVKNGPVFFTFCTAIPTTCISELAIDYLFMSARVAGVLGDIIPDKGANDHKLSFHISIYILKAVRVIKKQL